MHYEVKKEFFLLYHLALCSSRRFGVHSKAQLISKCFFGTYLQFFQKTNKKIQPNYYGTSRRIVFIRFLEELKTPKNYFEINWPLVAQGIVCSKEAQPNAIFPS